MIDLVLDALAAYRLTKLVVDDELTVDARGGLIEAAYVSAGRREEAVRGISDELLDGSVWEQIVAQDPSPPKLATLVTCPWCAGMWVAFGVVAARRAVPRLWAPLAKALAMSATTGLLAAADG